MTREEIISGLKFTIDMFMFDPSTGETFTEPRNDMDKTTIDACKGAIELLEQEPCEDCISRQAAIDADAEIAPMLIGEQVHFENVTFKHDIEQVPRIEAEPVKHAHVVWTESNTSHKTQCCSNCHRTFISRPDETIEFCPHCGAKIDDHEGELK